MYIHARNHDSDVVSLDITLSNIRNGIVPFHCLLILLVQPQYQVTMADWEPK